MAADRDTLKTELRKFCDPFYDGFEGFPLTRAAAIARWTAAFNIYGLTSEDLSTDGLVSGDTSGFSGQLVSQWIGNNGTWVQGADALADAWEDYWAPPVGAVYGIAIPCPAGGVCPNVPSQDMTIEFTSAVTTVAGQGEVYVRLLAMFSDPGGSLGDPEAWVEALADILHEESTEMGNVNIHIDGERAGTPPIHIVNDCRVF